MQRHTYRAWRLMSTSCSRRGWRINSELPQTAERESITKIEKNRNLWRRHQVGMGAKLS